MSTFVTCPLGCGFTHSIYEKNPRHNSVWLMEQWLKSTEEIKKLKQTNSELLRFKGDAQQANITLRKVNEDLHAEIQRLMHPVKKYKWWWQK